MPGAVSESSHILLTGASGFLAVHVATELLQRGYSVRGTVRSKDKGEYLDKLFASSGDKWSWVIVEDVETDGAFDEAVKGVDGIAHTGQSARRALQGRWILRLIVTSVTISASPFHFNVTDPYKDLINPAVNGTNNILKSALLESKVQRIVITSSFASIVNPEPTVYTFTEKDWNHFSLEQVKEKGVDVEPARKTLLLSSSSIRNNHLSILFTEAYRASKTLAEKAAWDFVEKHTKNGVAPFDIATINPPLIFGPILHDVKSASSLNTSVGAFYAFLTGAKKDDDALTPFGSFVDVRDVAKLHVDALSKQEAGGKRFAASAGSSFYYQLALDALQGQSVLSQFPKAITGHPHATAPVQNLFDASRAKELFNWTPVSLQKTFVDMAESLAERQTLWADK
ncbi:hypothetical protein P7C70_g5036, partial [Phenoliferia sp. Uapishka_3]